MRKKLAAGVIAGIFLTEVLGYFASRSPVLFYCSVLAGALTASIISRRAAGGFIIAGYVVLWKIVGMALLMGTYGVETVLRGISPFLIDWAVAILVAVAGGYAGVFIGTKIDKERAALE